MLLNLGVEKTKQGAIITIDTSARKEEGDYSAFEMMLALASAGRLTKDKEKKTPFEVTRQVQAPFFADLQKQKLLDLYTGLAIASLRLDGTQQWLEENKANFQKYGQWIDAHSTGKPVTFAPPK